MLLKVRTALLYSVAFLLQPLYALYVGTIRVRLVNNEVSPLQLPKDTNAIYVFWHSKTFLLLPFYKDLRIGVLTLLDWKNVIYDCLSRSFGYQTVRVASFQSAGVELKNLLDNHFHIALALDGPRGPSGTLKRGALHLSRTTGKPIIAVNIRCEKSFRLPWRWDKYEVPLPFTSATLCSSAPIYVNDENLEDAEQKIKSHLTDL